MCYGDEWQLKLNVSKQSQHVGDEIPKSPKIASELIAVALK